MNTNVQKLLEKIEFNSVYPRGPIIKQFKYYNLETMVKITKVAQTTRKTLMAKFYG